MASACYPLSVLPGLSQLFQAYIAGNAEAFYPCRPEGHSWLDAGRLTGTPPLAHTATLADLLQAQNNACHGGPAASRHIDQLREGARAVVTGQQVGLFGGPLYTLHKAATAVRLAQEATRRTGVPHVPIFWLATEDHDYAEVDHATMPGPEEALHTIRLGQRDREGIGAPVGALRLGPSVAGALEKTATFLGNSPELELLRRCYRPEATFAGAFAQWLAATFREQGLIVFDAAGRAAHALGRPVLRRALTEGEELEQLLLARGQALEAAGFHQQVLVKPGASLLFLLAGEAENEPHTRMPLRRGSHGQWSAGHTAYSTSQLLDLLEGEPERFSPNALLRPVFQDAILPTAAYIGGPAEIAYFAQTAVLHQHLLGRQTPVLPRLSATLLNKREAAVLEHDGIDLPDIFRMPLEELVQRVGARHMPLETKQRLHAAGSSMTQELEALTAWMRSLDPELGRSADVAANKMRYQLNRLRRLAARRGLERNSSIRKRITAVRAAAYPEGHLQERSIAAVAALARFGPGLPAQLIAAAGDPCPGHKLLQL